MGPVGFRVRALKTSDDDDITGRGTTVQEWLVKKVKLITAAVPWKFLLVLGDLISTSQLLSFDFLGAQPADTAAIKLLNPRCQAQEPRTNTWSYF